MWGNKEEQQEGEMEVQRLELAPLKKEKTREEGVANCEGYGQVREAQSEESLVGTMRENINVLLYKASYNFFVDCA